MAIVAISRGTLRGASELAQRVADALDVPCVSREVVVDAARRFGVDPEELTAHVERPFTFFDRYDTGRRFYLACVRAELCRRASEGPFVYHGHDGHLLLDGVPAVLRVRVVAPMAWRVEAVMQSEGLDRSRAARHVRRMDAHRARWTRFLYGVDWRDPELYDLVVNVGRLDLDDAASVVVGMAQRPTFATTPEALHKAADLALAARVEAELLRVPEVRRVELSVSAQGGIVTIDGHTRFQPLRETIEQTARKVTGVRDVRMRMEVPVDSLSRRDWA